MRKKKKILRQLWTLVGADPFIIDEIVELGLICIKGILYVRATHVGQARCLARVRFILITLWRFGKYTESRWITAGVSNRRYTGTMLTGMTDMAKEMIEDPDESNYFIAGIKRLTPEIQHAIVVAGLSSGVTEACLRCVLTDGRIMKTWPEVQVTAREEILFLDSIYDETWALVAEATNWTGAECRTHCLFTAHVSISFMDFRFFPG